MTKAQAKVTARLDEARKRASDFAAFVQTNDYAAKYGADAPFAKNMNESSLGLLERAVERAEKSVERHFAKRVTRDVASELRAFLAKWDTFDVGFVNYRGRGGADLTVQMRNLNAEGVAQYVRYALAVNMACHFVYGRSGDKMDTFKFDLRNTKLADFSVPSA